MAFAGVWETWMGPNGEEMETAAIVTTAANRTLAPIHDRMPVMLTPDAFDPWLDCADVNEREAATLMTPARDELLDVYPVSSAVNRVANDSPALLERISSDEIEQMTRATPPASKRKLPIAQGDDQLSLF
jgi:putative SOS response-associated peptidase YedK